MMTASTRADEHRVAHRLDRVAHERRLIVHRLERARPAAASCAAFGRDRRDAVGDRDGVAADLPRDVEQRGRLAVAGDDAHVIFGAQLRPSRGRARAARGRRRRSRCRRPSAPRCVGDDRGTACSPRGMRPTAFTVVDAWIAVGEVVVRHALRGEPRRIGDDLDLAHVAALHVDAADAGDAREERPDLIARDVVQRRRIAALEVVREDREERRRQALDLDVEVRRQVARGPDSRAPAPAAARSTMSVFGENVTFDLAAAADRRATARASRRARRSPLPRSAA